MSELFTVLTWNMDHWKRDAPTRKRGWSLLSEIGADAALLQETVPPADYDRHRLVYRPIAGVRPWGNAIATSQLETREVQSVRPKGTRHTFATLGTFPGTIVVANVPSPHLGPITLVSVYGMMEGTYAQTTMHRIIADLIPLFDSPDGEHVVLGGDFNVTTACSPSNRHRPRYAAILRAVEALGLRNLAEVAQERPGPLAGCACGDAPCTHLGTYRGKSDQARSQLDYLFATPALAQMCTRVWVADEQSLGLSDHVPIVVEFATAQPALSSESFVNAVAARTGVEAGVSMGKVLDWARRKHIQLKTTGRGEFSLSRLPTSSGPLPELWVQLDKDGIEGFQYTCSFRADGRVVVQFQYMRSPFDTSEARSSIRDELNRIPGVSLEARLNGRPTFPIAALAPVDSLERFLAVMENVVDETAAYHRTDG